MHFANFQNCKFIWGRVYSFGKYHRGKVYDSLQEYSPLVTMKAGNYNIYIALVLFN